MVQSSLDYRSQTNWDVLNWIGVPSAAFCVLDVRFTGHPDLKAFDLFVICNLMMIEWQSHASDLSQINPMFL